MLQHLHYYWLDGRHLYKGEALLQQLFQFPVSVSRANGNTAQQHQGCFRRRNRGSKSQPTTDAPVLFFAFCNNSHPFHQLFPKLIKDRLVELQPRRSVKVEEGQSRLEGWQQDAIFHLQSFSIISGSFLDVASQFRDINQCSLVSCNGKN